MNNMGSNLSINSSAATSDEIAPVLDESPAAEIALGEVAATSDEIAPVLDESPAAEIALGEVAATSDEIAPVLDESPAAEIALGETQESATKIALDEIVAIVTEAPPDVFDELVEYQYNKFIEELNYIGIQRNPQYFIDRVTEIPNMLERIVVHLSGANRSKDSESATNDVSVFDGVTNLMSIFIIIGDIDCIKCALDNNPGLHLKGISAYKPLITYWQSEPVVAQEMVTWLNENGATWIDNPMMLELRHCSLDFVKFLFDSGVYYSAYEAARPMIAEYNSLIRLNRGLKQAIFNPVHLSEKARYLLEREGALSFITADYFDIVAAEAISVVDVEAAADLESSEVVAVETRQNYGDKYTMREFLYELVCFDVAFVDIVYRKIPADLIDRFAALHLDNLIFSIPFDNEDLSTNPNYLTQLAAIQYILTNFPYIFSQLMFGNRLQISELVENERIKYDLTKYIDADDIAMYNKK